MKQYKIMEKNLKIQKTTLPPSNIGQDEWSKEFKVGSGYIEPVKYYQRNYINTDGTANQVKVSWQEKLFKFLNLFS